MVNAARYVRYCKKGHTYIPETFDWGAGEILSVRPPERCHQCGARLPWSRWRTDKWITIRRICGHYWREFKTLDGAKVTLLIVVGLVALMLVGKITIPQLVELVKVIKE